MFKLLGKALVFLAALAFTAGVSLFIIGSAILTWPIMRLSPRDRKRAAIMQLGVSLFALAQALTPDPAENSRPSPPKSAP